MGKSRRFINPLCPNSSLNLAAAGDEEQKDTHGGLTFVSLCVSVLNTHQLIQKHKHGRIILFLYQTRHGIILNNPLEMSTHNHNL